MHIIFDMPVMVTAGRGAQRTNVPANCMISIFEVHDAIKDRYSGQIFFMYSTPVS